MPDTNDPTFLTPAPGDAPTRDPASGGDTSARTTDAGPSTSVGPGGPAARVPDIPGYELHEELGRGGIGVVYRARQVKLDRVVAVKVLLRPDLTDVTTRRFDTEARAVARMQHPNIVQVFEVGEADGRAFLALEYVPGGTLARKVADALLPPRAAAALLATLAAAVQYAHEQGVIHRDLKPGNVLLAADGTPKIADFGLARPTETDSDLTAEGAILGTPSYMPPEQAAGDAARVGPASDVYSLGAILYDLLTGRPPFKGSSVMDTLEQVRTAEPTPPASLQPGVPRDLETICLKCLEKEPGRRYAGANDLADDLRRFLDGRPIVARPVSAPERAWRWCKRNPRVAGLAAAVAGLLVVLAAGSATAAVVINESRREAAARRDENAAQRDENARQRDEIAAREREVTAQKKLADGRLELYRAAMDAFVNEAPDILDGYPLAAEPAAELNRLAVRLLAEANKEIDDRGQNDRGKLALLLRRAEFQQAEGKAADAEKTLAEAEALARRLAAPGNPERDKAAGNLALCLNTRAGLLQARAAADTDLVRSRKALGDVIALRGEALAVQSGVLDSPASGEIPRAEARTWVASTHRQVAEAHRLTAARSSTDDARTELAAAAAHAGTAERAYREALADPGIAGRLRNRTRSHQMLAALDAARIASDRGKFAGHLDRLVHHAAADAAFARAVALGEALVKEFPKNLEYRRNLSIAAAECGDFLLMRRNDPAAARRVYTLAVVHLRPLAEPDELYPYLNTLALNYYRVGTALLDQGEEKEARRVYGLGADVREQQLRLVLKSAGGSDPARQVTPRLNLMLAQARAGKHAEAAAFARELLDKHANTPRWLVQSACGFGLSAAVVPAGEAGLKAAYLDKAFVALAKAVEGGYAHPETLEFDPDLEPLRADPRFPPLLAKARENRAKVP